MTALATRATEIAAELVSAQVAFAAAEQEAQVERNAIAGGETLGEVTPAQARRKRARIETKLNGMRERVDTLSAAVPELERRVAEEEQKAHTSEVQSARRRFDHALKARQSASRNLTRDLRQVEHSASELRRHRGLVDQAAQALSARLHRDCPPEDHPQGGDSVARGARAQPLGEEAIGQILNIVAANLGR